MDDTPLPRIIEDELSIQILDEDLRSIQLLNPQQKMTFDIITQSVVHNESKLFFIDGPGGTGKTFLYRSILAHLRKQGKIVIAVATSGIAATLLPGGRTAHSRLKIPLMSTADTLCKIEKQSDLAELIRRASAIVWDEAPMANRYSFESVNKTFQDIMGNVLAFGGKTMVFGGDFRQVLPVVKRGSVREQIAANTVKSDFIRLPETMIIPWEGEQSMKQLIDFVFPNMMENVNDANYMVGRAIITPKNVDVDIINDILISNFPGEEKEYISWDSVEDDNNNFFQEEFLNSLTPSDLPPHIITLKVGCPIMLLRNVAPELGLCNGTRLICRSLGRNFINAEIITSPHKDTSIISFHRPPILSSSTSRISLSLPPRVDEGQGRPPPTPSRFLRWSLAAAPHSHVPPHAPTTAVSADSRGFHREKDHTDRSSASDHRPRCPRRPQPPSSGKLVTTDHQLQKLLDRGCAHVVPVQEGITDAQTTQPQPRLIAGAPTVAVLHG
ncbi:ATP-dependent DNA helicase pif1-like [Zingiber officinale]|uniref:ATP-dependent DNA helicase pif1-like n=1 Tax=Zingiber officinale TaxID=94328 RepID=UPI001C4C33A4|nr:ATP-dependent DNA helicase pif1-like [Zingiber officinale]